MSSPLAGARELISDTQEGIVVFTGSHFNIDVVGKPGPDFQSESRPSPKPRGPCAGQGARIRSRTPPPSYTTW